MNLSSRRPAQTAGGSRRAVTLKDSKSSQGPRLQLLPAPPAEPVLRQVRVPHVEHRGPSLAPRSGGRSPPPPRSLRRPRGSS